MTDLTPLQQGIKDAIELHPNKPDEWIAQYVYEDMNPGQSWEEAGRKSPTATYVAKRRRRHSKENQPPQIEVEMPEFLFTPADEESDDEEQEEFDPLSSLDEAEGEEPQEDASQGKPVSASIQAAMYDVSVDDVSTIIGLPFNKLAKYTGYDGWRLDPADPDDAKFIELSHRMGYKYLPDILERYGLEVMWSITALGFFGDRIVGYKKHRAEKQGSIEEQLKKEAPPEPEPEPEAPAEPEPEKPKPKPGQLAAGEDEFTRRHKAR